MARDQRPTIRPTFLDRMVEWWDPKAGIQRRYARSMLALAGGYEGGRRDRRGTKRWRAFEGSADSDTLPDLPTLRARSRDLVRNVPIATGAVATMVTGVVGDGLTLQSQIDRELLPLSDEEADRWQDQAEREWELFAATCDFTRVQDFGELQELCFRAILDSGDVLVVRRFDEGAGTEYATKIQIVEADRISNPNREADSDKIIAGVEVGSSGAPIAYHVSDRHPGEIRRKTMRWERLPAVSSSGIPLALHLFHRLRPDQTRGVPYLAPVIELIKQLGDYTDAEVRAAVVSSLYTVFITSNSDNESTPIAGEKDPTLADNELKLGSGAIVSLNTDEDVSFADPKRPNTAFDPFMESIFRQLGVALELPFEVLIKHFTASYSASRAALEMAWQVMRKRRLWLARRLCQPVYAWCIEEAVARGRLAAPGFFDDPLIRMAYLGAEWIGPQRMSLDPQKEAKADEIDIALGTKTIDQVCIERTGGTFERKHSQRVKEIEGRREAGIEQDPPAETSNDDVIAAVEE